MDSKARAALVLLRSNWFEKTQLSDGLKELSEDQALLAKKLNEFLDIDKTWQVYSEASLCECGKYLAESVLDLVILIFLTHVDQTWMEKLPDILKGHPLVAWCYLPWKRIPHTLTYEEFLRTSGSASMFSMFGSLHRAQIPFLATFGSLDDPMVKRDLVTYAAAARAVQATKLSKSGVLLSSIAEELATPLLTAGIQFERIAVQEYEQAFRSVLPDEIDEYLVSLEELSPEYMVTTDTIRLSASISIALRKIAETHQLDLLIVPDHDAGIRAITHLCPGLPPDPTGKESVIYQSILNPGVIFANLITKQLTGEAGFLMKLWFWDKARNLFVGGNTGLQNQNFATHGQTYIIGDYECSRDDPDGGAQLEFIVHPGRVTLLQMLPSKDGWQAIGTTGICLERELWVEGVPQAVIRLDPAIDDFLSTLAEMDTTQYWVLGYGNYLSELKACFDIMNISFQVIKN
jgi:hypothetical protein